MILPKIILKRICNASAFFFSNPCPFCAPCKRDFINICALDIKMHSWTLRKISDYKMQCNS